MEVSIYGERTCCNFFLYQKLKDFDQHGGWVAESKSRWCMLRKNGIFFWYLPNCSSTSTNFHGPLVSIWNNFPINSLSNNIQPAWIFYLTLLPFFLAPSNIGHQPCCIVIWFEFGIFSYCHTPIKTQCNLVWTNWIISTL